MVIPVNLALLTLLVVVAIAVARIRDVFAQVVLFAIYSLLCAALFTVLDAPDVAITEAAVGAGMSTILMLVTLALVGRDDKPRPRVPWLATIVVVATGAALVYGVLDAPLFGDPGAPAHVHIAPYYLRQTPVDIAIPNVVTAVLATYRGFDTLGEVTVVFTAGIAVVFLLHGLQHPQAEAGSRPEPVGRGAVDGGEEEVGGEGATEGEAILAVPSGQAHVTIGGSHAWRDHVVLRVVAKLLLPAILMFALYVQGHGEVSPGGGFSAGVIFATGIVLFALVAGIRRARNLLSARWIEGGMAAGLLLFLGVGVATLVLDGRFLDYDVLGSSRQSGQHVGIVLIELGVGLTVAAVMVAIFFSFASVDPAEEAA